MKNRAIELARQAGGTCFAKDGRYGNYQAGSVLFTPDEFKRFYQLVRNEAFEDAAIKCYSMHYEVDAYPAQCADAVRAMKEPT